MAEIRNDGGGERVARPLVSIVIKALNEAHNIGRTLDSVFAAVVSIDAEVILADSLSTDDTVRIALEKGATVVQLQHAEDRCCGVGPQLGYQHSSGRFVLILDGDMDLMPGFLEASIELMNSDPAIAGVGGQMEEMNIENTVFAQRLKRSPNLTRVGDVPHLDGGGLYRREALESAGYFSNPTLHSYEELELGCRLRAAGWRMVRLERQSVRHHGHELPRYQLLRRRFRSRYAWGPGELLRASLFQKWFFDAVRTAKAYLMVLFMWLLLLAGVLLTPWSAAPLVFAIALQPLLLLALVVKRRGLGDGIFAYASWNVFALGTLIGFLRSPKNPRARIPSRIIATP